MYTPPWTCSERTGTESTAGWESPPDESRPARAEPWLDGDTSRCPGAAAYCGPPVSTRAVATREAIPPTFNDLRGNPVRRRLCGMLETFYCRRTLAAARRPPWGRPDLVVLRVSHRDGSRGAHNPGHRHL